MREMKIRYPEYYGKFHCLAGACPDTCCVGWEIRIDRKSRLLYRNIKKSRTELGKKLRKYIRCGKIVPVQGKCPFLKADGLCGIMTELGEDAACRTCRNYPRHREDYGRLQEVVLLLSCPEAARLVLTEEPARFRVREFPERSVDLNGIDEGFLETLLHVRELIWEIGLEKEMAFMLRMQRALALAHDVQRRLKAAEDGEMEAVRKTESNQEIEAVLSRYREDSGGRRFVKRLRRSAGKETHLCGGQNALAAHSELPRFLLMSDFMESLTELETISPDWPDMLESCRKFLYHSGDSRARYQGERERFFLECPEAEGWLERIFSYFIYSFFLAALYDRDVYGKVQMAVFCTWAAEELMLASQSREDSFLDVPDRLCHIFARQIENSGENRNLLEQILKRKEFGFRRLMEI